MKKATVTEKETTTLEADGSCQAEPTMSEPLPTITEAADSVSAKLNVDIIFYNGNLWNGVDDKLISICLQRKLRPRVMMIMVTHGGSADVGYRVARCLQRYYEKVTLMVPGVCKSAGTLTALGAHELVIGDHGQLGPLDVQIYKRDELGEMLSGATPLAALDLLLDQAFIAFEHFFLKTRQSSGGLITIPTAARIATDMATGLLGSVYGQLNPMNLGEIGRELNVATEYGERLIRKSQNLTLANLEKLTVKYPSHGFVIDREEACDLFKRVRKPSQEEALLITVLGDAALTEQQGLAPDQMPFVAFLSSEIEAADPDESPQAGGMEHEDTAGEKPDDDSVDGGTEGGDSGQGEAPADDVEITPNRVKARKASADA